MMLKRCKNDVNIGNNELIELESALAQKIASRASQQYRCLHNHAVLSLLWHAEFRFRSFIYFISPLLQQAYKTARQEVCLSPPPPPAAASFRRHRHWSRPRPGGQRARPRRRRRPRPQARLRRRRRPRPQARLRSRLRLRPASGATGACHGHVQGGMAASVFAAGAGHGRRPRPPTPAAAAGAVRGQRSLSLPSPQVAPAAATSASALQASKFYSGEPAESISDNSQ